MGYRTFGELLDDYLREKKTSNAQLARKLGVDRSNITKWIQGETKPSSDLVIKILGILKLNETEARVLLMAAGYIDLIDLLRLSTPENKEPPDKPEVVDIIAKVSESNESQHKELLDAVKPIHSLQTGASEQINTPEEDRLNISKDRENTVIAINEDDQGNKAVTKTIVAQQALVITGLSSREQIRQAHLKLPIWVIPILIVIILFWLGYSLVIKPFIAPSNPERLLTATGNGGNANIEQSGNLSSAIYANIGEGSTSITQISNQNSIISVTVGGKNQTMIPNPTPFAPSQGNSGSGRNVSIEQTGSHGSIMSGTIAGEQPARLKQADVRDSTMEFEIGPEETAIPILEKERSLEEIIASTPLTVEFESEIWKIGTELYFNKKTYSQALAEIPSVSDSCMLDIGGKFLIKAFYGSFRFRVESLVKDIDKLGITDEHIDEFFDVLTTLYPDDVNITFELLTDKKALEQFILSKHRSANDQIQAFLGSFQLQLGTTHPFKSLRSPSYPDYVIGIYSSYDGSSGSECHDADIIAIPIAQLKEMGRSFEEVTSIKN